MSKVLIKRVYDPVSEADGYRVLVDRLWPRGVSKERAKIEVWLKEVGPSSELRKWFNHDPIKYSEFREKYEKELEANPALRELKEIVKSHDLVTLVYSAHDSEHNQAQVLLGLLK